MFRIILIAFFIILASVQSLPIAAQVYKCTNAQGKTAFSDRPCLTSAKLGEQATQEKIKTASDNSNLDNIWLCDKSLNNLLFKPVQTEWESLAKAAKTEQTEQVEGIIKGIALGSVSPLGSKEAFQQTTVAHDENQRIHICVPHKQTIKGEVTEGFNEYVVELNGRVVNKRLSGKIKFYNDANNDPFTLQRRCGDLVTSCFQPKVAGHSLHECFAAAPVCPEGKLAANVQCCPGACYQNYREKRTQKVDPLSALQHVLYDEKTSCIPGVVEGLGGKR